MIAFRPTQLLQVLGAKTFQQVPLLELVAKSASRDPDFTGVPQGTRGERNPLDFHGIWRLRPGSGLRFSAVRKVSLIVGTMGGRWLSHRFR